MLSIGELGAGRASADYYLARQAGCPSEYYTGSGERRGTWLGSGAASFGLSGEIDEEPLRRLLAGRHPRQDVQLVAPVLRADPRGRVPAAPLAEALHRVAASRTTPAEHLLCGDLGRAAGRVLRAGRRDERLGGTSRTTVRADVAGRICATLGLDPDDVYAAPNGKRSHRFAAALSHAEERIDVRVAGFDVTLSAPKSVSLLYGLANSDIAEQVRLGHDAAVAAALGYLETETARGLRGHHGDGQVARTVTSSGLVAAAFQHRANRCGDPQLHTHVVVANLVLGTDGQGSALDSTALYAAGKTAGYLYQAVLRHQLTARLGVGWTPVGRGVAEVVGIPPTLCRAFSKRRQQIEALLRGAEDRDAKAAQQAALASRPAKDRTVTEPTLRKRWAAEARDHGYQPGAVVEVLHRAEAPGELDAVQLRWLVDALAGPDGLTKNRSTFDRQDALRGVCEALQWGGTSEQIGRYADAVLSDRDVVPLLGEPPLPADAHRCYSTAELLVQERRALTGAIGRVHEGVGVTSTGTVAETLAKHPLLNHEQRATVRRLLTSGAGVDVVIGRPGAGKTTGLRAAAAGWQDAGYRVIGCALAAAAARQLSAGAGIPATSITRLLADTGRRDPDTGRPAGLGTGVVLVLDEAGMVGTRTLCRLLDLAADDGAKLVAVGDPAQLPEMQAGGLFAALGHELGATELTSNLRQEQPWEQAALERMRAGDVAGALAAYAGEGRIHTADGVDELRRLIVGDWWLARCAAADPGAVLMLTVRRSDAAALNAAARRHMTESGELAGPALTVRAAGLGERTFAVGDQVIVVRNTYDRGALNGTRGTVTAVELRANTLTLHDRQGQTIVLDHRHLRDGRLDHGYATTCHKAQGVTVDTALLYGTAALSREAGYVALSRGRRANHLFSVADELEGHLARSHEQDLDDMPVDRLRADLMRDSAPGVLSGLARVLQRSSAQRLASYVVDQGWHRALE